MNVLRLVAVFLSVLASPAMARDLYLTNGTQNGRFYLDVQSIQTKEVNGSVIRVFEAEGYQIKPSGDRPSALNWSLAANCSVPYQVATLSQTAYDEKGQLLNKSPYHLPGQPYSFESYQETDLWGDFWLAACRGESMQLKEHRMFARSVPEVLQKLRKP